MLVKERRQRGKQRRRQRLEEREGCAEGGGSVRLRGRLSLVAGAAPSPMVAFPGWTPEAGRPLSVQGAVVFQGN